MKSGKPRFKPVGLPRALLESLGLGLVLFGVLALLDPDPQSSLTFNSSLFIFTLLPFWLMIRLRVWGFQLVEEC